MKRKTEEDHMKRKKDALTVTVKTRGKKNPKASKRLNKNNRRAGEFIDEQLDRGLQSADRHAMGVTMSDEEFDSRYGKGDHDARRVNRLANTASLKLRGRPGYARGGVAKKRYI